MKRNVISDLPEVGWSDPARQNEFVLSVISALSVFGEKPDYDYVCSVSGCAFRTSFSVTGWNHGNYHVIHTPCVIEHTFKMLGYGITRRGRSGYEEDKKRITDSIDRGVPVITLEGVIRCSDACVISGYDDGGNVLLGYSPFMYIPDDHNEPHDGTGYFRKSDWHGGTAGGSRLNIITVGEKCGRPSDEDILGETLKTAASLIMSESMSEGQHNGIKANKAFADALLTCSWDDNFEPYLNVMCNYKQYLDKRYAVQYLTENGRQDLASYYRRITELTDRLAEIIPQDFSASGMFGDKENLKPFAQTLLEISALEEEFVRKI